MTTVNNNNNNWYKNKEINCHYLTKQMKTKTTTPTPTPTPTPKTRKCFINGLKMQYDIIQRIVNYIKIDDDLAMNTGLYFYDHFDIYLYFSIIMKNQATLFY
jgi:hypothetical protein